MKKNHKLRGILIGVIFLIMGIAILYPVISKSWTSEQDAPAATPTVKSGPGGGSRTIPVMVSLVKSEQVLDGIRAVGSLVANEEVDLASDISGKIQQINFEEGTRVTKGDVLVKVNDDDLLAQLKRYKFQEKTLGEKLERQRYLLEREAISAETFDQVQTEYNVLQADIQILKVKIDRTEIRAPFDGVVGLRYVSEGSYIQPNTKIAKMVDYNTLKLEFSIPEKYISMPLVGQTAYFTTAGSKKQNTAKIYAIEPKVDENTRTIILRAKYNNSNGSLRPGMSMKVTIPTSEVASTLMIPTEAVVPAMDNKSVWVVRQGAPVQQVIETGIRQERTIEVLTGLEEGDSVIITGLMQLREGAKIKVTN